MSRTTDVAIIGGGAIGCALAWTLARLGLDVTVVERDEPGRAASRAAGGMLSPIAEAGEPGPFLDLALASMDRWPGFVDAVREASGVPVEYRTEGKLHVAFDDERAEALRAAWHWQREAGHDVALLDAEEIRSLEPSLSKEVRTGLLITRDHWVDNRRLGEALWMAAARADVHFLSGESVLGVECGADGARATGVTLANGSRLSADRVVVAAGAWSGTLAGLPRPLPVEPVRGQIAAVRAVPPALTRVVMAGHCYLIPRGDGRLMIGATEERAGFRRHTTPAGIASLLSAAMRIVPSLAESAFEECWAGFRPGTPDGLPILGADPEVEALFYATGHYRNGILLTPISAEVVAAAVVGKEPALSLNAFAADRFVAGTVSR